MDEQEIMSMRYGSMLDMISKKKLTYDEIIRLK